MNKMYRYSEEDTNSIKELLLWRTVVEVRGGSFILDNGVELKVIPNEGCICGAGDYYIEKMVTVPHAITDVWFSDESSEYLGTKHTYKIFVLAFNMQEHELLVVEGDDGHGYCGTGYEIEVTFPYDN